MSIPTHRPVDRDPAPPSNSSPPGGRPGSSPPRRIALVAGLFYLLTFVSSIPALILMDPVLSDPAYLAGAAGGDTRVLSGNVLDLLNAVGCVGTAVALFPLLRRYGEAFALGFVTSRVLEAAVIAVGAIGLLSLVTLRQDAIAGSPAEVATLAAVGPALIVVHDWAFLLGPGLMAGINALLLGTLMYRSRLVPRAIPALGLVAAPLQVGSVLATVFGVYDQVSPVALLAALPIALWELSLGLWMTFKGFASAAES